MGFGEIDDMITTVDRNKDGKISYSEFRVRPIRELLPGSLKLLSLSLGIT